ncbi:DUF1833 domain-containing protein [Babesia caballi]|uniref:DUF1833 domain-containing protein n=1 Tax=Babesia caballi TaxID=5871 RepID=A0AAV4LSA0_BABCB|nr:DUF1833 domain-containing protein [Babesia caballi]
MYGVRWMPPLNSRRPPTSDAPTPLLKLRVYNTDSAVGCGVWRSKARLFCYTRSGNACAGIRPLLCLEYVLTASQKPKNFEISQIPFSSRQYGVQHIFAGD